MQEQTFVVGIDLGTTNSEVAALIDGKPVILREGPQDSGIVPSVVGLNAQDETIVGQIARNQWVTAPQRTIASIKRSMGENIQVSLGAKTFSPAEVSGIILKTLKEKAERVLGQAVTAAVITVPAYFTDAQRQATRAAGAHAGLEVKRIINEPTAAALAYNGESKDADGVALIYDLGGGTFDVSIVRMQDGVVEVLATAGNNRLGGDDFDAIIAQNLKEKIETRYEVRIDADDVVVQARLVRAAEAAKIALSKEPFTQIMLDNIAKSEGKAVNFSYELSRADLNTWLTPLLEDTMHLVSSALEDAKLAPAAISRVITVGGSSRMPYVHDLLHERLGHRPYSAIDPEMCVALGAAVQAGLEMGKQVDSILVDITPYTFGTEAIGNVSEENFGLQFCPLILRNTKLPAVATEVYYKAYDEQTVVDIRVFQGEHHDARQNIKLDDFRFEGLRTKPGDREKGILFTYKLDLDGILEVTAIERATHRRLVNRVSGALSDSPVSKPYDSQTSQTAVAAASKMAVDADQQAQIFDADDFDVSEEKATDSGVRAEISDLRLEISALRAKAQALRSKASASDSEDIDKLLEQLSGSAEDMAEEDVVKCMQQLDDLLFYLS